MILRLRQLVCHSAVGRHKGHVNWHLLGQLHRGCIRNTIGDAVSLGKQAHQILECNISIVIPVECLVILNHIPRGVALCDRSSI